MVSSGQSRAGGVAAIVAEELEIVNQEQAGPATATAREMLQGKELQKIGLVAAETWS